MSSYREAQVQLDPGQLEEYPNGVRIQEIEVIFTDDPERPSWRAVPCRRSAARSTRTAPASSDSGC